MKSYSQIVRLSTLYLSFQKIEFQDKHKNYPRTQDSHWTAMWNVVGSLSLSLSLSLSTVLVFAVSHNICDATFTKTVFGWNILSTHTVQINLTEQWRSTIHEGPGGLVQGPFRVRSGRGCCRWWSAVKSPRSTTKHCKMLSDLYSDLFLEIHFGGLTSKSYIVTSLNFLKLRDISFVRN